MTSPINGNPAPPGAPITTPNPPQRNNWVKSGNLYFDNQLMDGAEFVIRHLKVFIIFGILEFIIFVLTVAGTLPWPNGLGIGSTLLLAALFLGQKKPKEDCWPYFKRIGWGLLVLIPFPLFLPLLFTGYFYVSTKDWHRTFDPPVVYSLWNVNESDFADDAKSKLERWNPSKKENQELRRLVLTAAILTGADADFMAPFDPADLKKGEPFRLVVFESTTPIASPPPAPTVTTREDADAGVKAPKPSAAPKIGQLVVTFITPYEPEGDGSDAGTPDAGKVTAKKVKALRFRLVEQVVPDNMDLRLAFFLQGFSSSTGRIIDLQQLENWLQERMKRFPSGAPTPG